MRVGFHNRFPRLTIGLTAAAAALVLSGCLDAEGETRPIGNVNVDKLCESSRLGVLDSIDLGRAFRGDQAATQQAERTYSDMQEVICMAAGDLAASVVANAQVMPDDRPTLEIHMSVQQGENDPGVVVITEHNSTSNRQNIVTFGANQDGTPNLDDLHGVRVYSRDVVSAPGQETVVLTEASYEGGRWIIRQPAAGENPGTTTYPPEHFSNPAAVQAAWDGAASAAARLAPARD